MVGTYISRSCLIVLIFVSSCTAAGSDEEPPTKRPKPFAPLLELKKRMKSAEVSENEIRDKLAELEDYLAKELSSKPSQASPIDNYESSTPVPLITQHSRLTEQPSVENFHEWLSDEWLKNSQLNLDVPVATPSSSTRPARIRRFFDVEARLMDNYSDLRVPLHQPDQPDRPTQPSQPEATHYIEKPEEADILDDHDYAGPSYEYTDLYERLPQVFDVQSNSVDNFLSYPWSTTTTTTTTTSEPILISDDES